jgi:hypothetical protein
MRNDKAKCKMDTVNETVEWKWADDSTDLVALSDLPQGIVIKLALFGLKTKLSNTYASVPIMSASKKAFLVGLQALIDNIWSAGSTRVSLIARAVARVRGVSIEDAIAAVAKLDKVALAKLRKHPGVKHAMATIQLEDIEAEGVDDYDLDDILP